MEQSLYRKARYDKPNNEKSMEVFENSKALSKTIIDKFTKDIYGINKNYGEFLNIDSDSSIAMRGIYEKYISNIGQYYNGIGEHCLALLYHFKSLLIKSESFLKIYFKDGEKLFLEFKEMLNVDLLENNKFNVQILDMINISSQDEFWKKIKTINTIGEINNGKIVDKIKALGVSYRTISSDCYYIGDDAIKFGCKSIDIALEILSDKRISEKEQLSTLIRKIGIYLKNKEEKHLEDILKWCEKAEKEYLNNKEFFGEKIKKDLLCNINKFKENLIDNEEKILSNRLNKIEKELNEN